jgi:hypothetical protein
MRSILASLCFLLMSAPAAFPVCTPTLLTPGDYARCVDQYLEWNNDGTLLAYQGVVQHRTGQHFSRPNQMGAERQNLHQIMGPFIQTISSAMTA